ACRTRWLARYLKSTQQPDAWELADASSYRWCSTGAQADPRLEQYATPCDSAATLHRTVQDRSRPLPASTLTIRSRDAPHQASSRRLREIAWNMAVLCRTRPLPDIGPPNPATLQL